MPHLQTNLIAPQSSSRAVVTGRDKAFVYLRQPPARALAIPLDEAKAWLEIDLSDTTFDAQITAIIRAVTLCAENWTGLTFINQIYLTFRDFFTPNFQLKRAPIFGVNTIQYTDTDKVVQTVPDTDYAVTRDVFPFVFLQPESSWPSDFREVPEVVEINFTAGFGVATTDIPADIRLALLNHIASAFVNKGDCDAGECVPCGAKSVYDKRRIIDLAITHTEG